MFKRIFLIILLFIFCTSCNSSKSNHPPTEYPPESLPSIIIAYDALRSGYDFDGKDKDWSNYISKLEHQFQFFKKLNKNKDFAEIHSAELSFIIQNEIENQFYGFSSKNNNYPEPTTTFFMFITTPIKSLNNNILVIFSGNSPEETDIFEVDNKLNVKTLFQDFKDLLPDEDSICSTISVQVKKPGFFLLEERTGRHCGMPDWKRNFFLDVRDGHFKIYNADKNKNDPCLEEKKNAK